jgi:hypothetical protein
VRQILLAEEPIMPGLRRNWPVTSLRSDKAFAITQTFLETNPTHEPGAVTVGLTLSRMLLDAKKYLEAAQGYVSVLQRPVGSVAEVYWGAARANEKASQ